MANAKNGYKMAFFAFKTIKAININKLKRKIGQKDDNHENGRPMSDWDYNQKRADDDKRTDEILDKISKGGYDSLTKEEKEFLFKQSKKN